MEGILRLRGKTALTVTLRVESGKVKGPAIASEDGGIFSLVMRVIQNKVNAEPSGSESRNRSDGNSAVTSASMTGATSGR